jgi:hypothetical protein
MFHLQYHNASYNFVLLHDKDFGECGSQNLLCNSTNVQSNKSHDINVIEM